MIHALKTTPQFFEDIISGKKTFEVRKNDRDFRECDYVALNEYDINKPLNVTERAESERYSGRSALFQISYILDNAEYCKAGYVVLGLMPCAVTIPCALDIKELTALHVRGQAIPVLYGQARGGGGE